MDSNSISNCNDTYIRGWVSDTQDIPRNLVNGQSKCSNDKHYSQYSIRIESNLGICKSYYHRYGHCFCSDGLHIKGIRINDNQ